MVLGLALHPISLPPSLTHTHTHTTHIPDVFATIMLPAIFIYLL